MTRAAVVMLKPDERTSTVAIRLNPAPGANTRYFKQLTAGCRGRDLLRSPGNTIDVYDETFAFDTYDVIGYVAAAEFFPWMVGTLHRIGASIDRHLVPATQNAAMPVVGTIHYAQPALAEATKASLVWVTNNAVNPFAVAVVVDGKQIGWLPDAQCEKFLRHAQSSETEAFVKNLNGKLVVFFKLGHTPATSDSKRFIQELTEQSDNLYAAGPDGIVSINKSQPKEDTMSTIKSRATQVVVANKNAATDAAYLEASRIAMNKLVEVIKPKLPMMIRGYADHPIGRLVIANLAIVAQQQFKPDSKLFADLAQSMATDAYITLLSQLNIEDMIDDILESKEVTRAVKRAGVRADSED